jgi:hypothetical protein
VRSSTWRSEGTSVEKLGHELRMGVKGQSNSEIAGSPRNRFRSSLAELTDGGRALIGLGDLPVCRSQSNSECRLDLTAGVRERGISFVPERETTQTTS